MFIETQEYHRFLEFFCHACRRDRYVGVNAELVEDGSCSQYELDIYA